MKRHNGYCDYVQEGKPCDCGFAPTSPPSAKADEGKAERWCVMEDCYLDAAPGSPHCDGHTRELTAERPAPPALTRSEVVEMIAAAVFVTHNGRMEEILRAALSDGGAK